MIIAIFMIVLAMIGAGATIVCSLMYFKKWGHTSKMSVKPSATLGEQGSKTCIVRGESVYRKCITTFATYKLLFYQQMKLTIQLMLS